MIKARLLAVTAALAVMTVLPATQAMAATSQAATPAAQTTMTVPAPSTTCDLGNTGNALEDFVLNQECIWVYGGQSLGAGITALLSAVYLGVPASIIYFIGSLLHVFGL
jgi:hypothetical protein